MFDVRCLRFVVYCVLFIVCCLLFVVNHALRVVSCAVFAVCCLLYVAWRLFFLFDVFFLRSVFGVCCLLLFEDCRLSVMCCWLLCCVFSVV